MFGLDFDAMRTSLPQRGVIAYGIQSTIVAGCGGYVYGTIEGVNPLLAAKAFAISMLIAELFTSFDYHRYQDDSKFEKERSVINLAFLMVGGATLTIAFRNLQLISSVGTTAMTAFFGLCAVKYTIDHLRGKYFIIR